MMREYDASGIAIPARAPRPPRSGARADRAFAANVLVMACGFALMGYQLTGYFVS